MNRTIRQFELVERIGTGSMGTIWRAVQTTLDRDVAIKELHPLLARDQEFLTRFEREAKTAGTLQHENIVAVIDYGKEGDTYFLALEYVDGTNVEDLLASAGDLPVSVVATITVDVLKGLEHAHRRGVTHRDVKPANIMLTREGQAKVADFSIAVATQMPKITQTGAMMGTPAYMSPEQVTGRPLSGATDLFSLGVIMYELCTGQRPFEGAQYPIIISNILNHEPKNLNEVDPQIPASFAAVVARALEKDTTKRYKTAADFRADLERVCDAEAIPISHEAVAVMLPDPENAKQQVRAEEARFAAEVARARNDPDTAASLLERAVLLDPGSEEYRTELVTRTMKLRRRSRRQFAIAFLVSTLLVTVGVYVLWRFVLNAPQDVTKTTPTATQTVVAVETTTPTVIETETIASTTPTDVVEQTTRPTHHRTRHPTSTQTQVAVATPSVADVYSTATPEATPPPTPVAAGPPGSVKVLVPGSNAYVWIDQHYLDNTGVHVKVFDEIGAGTRKVRLYHAGWDGRFETDVTVKSNTQARVTWNIQKGPVLFKPKTNATYKVYSRPPAPVPAQYLGTTAQPIELTVGWHSLDFQQAGCPKRTHKIRVSPKRSNVIELPDLGC